MSPQTTLWGPERLASAVGGPSVPFTPGVRLSSLCRFFADESRLLVIVRPTVGQVDAASGPRALLGSVVRT